MALRQREGNPNSLTVDNAAADSHGLEVAIVWCSFGMLLAAAYFVYAYRGSSSAPRSRRTRRQEPDGRRWRLRETTERVCGRAPMDRTPREHRSLQERGSPLMYRTTVLGFDVTDQARDALALASLLRAEDGTVKSPPASTPPSAPLAAPRWSGRLRRATRRPRARPARSRTN